MATDTVVISWNVTNWITVLVIVAVGALVIGTALGLWNKARGTNNATT